MISARQPVISGISAALLPVSQPRDVGKDDRECVAFRPAMSRAEREAAHHLTYEAYLRRRLCRPNRFRMRVTPYHLVPTTELFIAVAESNVVGTLSLAFDGELGLPMEDVFAKEVGARRAQGLKLAEACSLAIADGGRSCQQQVFGLYRLMAQFADYQGADQILAAVQPKHLRIYQRFMAFETFGDVQSYPACECQAIPICLDLNEIRRNPPRNYRRFFGVALDKHLLQTAI